MGMFDRLFDAAGAEWQTKAFHRELDRYRIGDRLPGRGGDYQVEVLGGDDGTFIDSFATVRAGLLVAVGAPRNPDLPLVGYYGEPGPSEGPPR